MITINNDDLRRYELDGADLISAIKYGRSLKAFKTNQLRAEATRLVERMLGMSQKEFARVAKPKRVELVQTKTRSLVNELKLRYKATILMETL